MTTVVIAQPTYMPWMGYFEAISRADIWISLNSVQFERQSWQSRNRVLSPDGSTTYITVPTRRAALSTPLKDILIAEEHPWAMKHLKTIRSSLTKAAFREEALDLVEPILLDHPRHLADLNYSLIQRFAKALGFEPEWVDASDLNDDGKRSELVVNLIRAVGGDHYYSAAGSETYMSAEADQWDHSGICVEFQRWEHPSYKQLGGRLFVSHLSIIDAIANVGLSATRSMILNR